VLLTRILQSQGFGSRRQCAALIRSGAVACNGETLLDPDADVPTAGLVLAVDGETCAYREHAYVVMNKPAGYECSRSPRHHPGVFGLLPAPLVTRGVQCVGRLDADTTGLLLFSDDGAFIHRLISPRKAIPKVYRVRCKHPVADDLPARLVGGVALRDEALPVAARACVKEGTHGLLLTLGEGKYHQVKRMVAAAGNRVEALERIAIGGLALPADLPIGGWRYLDAHELAQVEHG
jgi:16S rRNA pseudouridine516 synthase